MPLYGLALKFAEHLADVRVGDEFRLDVLGDARGVFERLSDIDHETYLAKQDVAHPFPDADGGLPESAEPADGQERDRSVIEQREDFEMLSGEVTAECLRHEGLAEVRNIRRAPGEDVEDLGVLGRHNSLGLPASSLFSLGWRQGRISCKNLHD